MNQLTSMSTNSVGGDGCECGGKRKKKECCKEKASEQVSTQLTCTVDILERKDKFFNQLIHYARYGPSYAVDECAKLYPEMRIPPLIRTLNAAPWVSAIERLYCMHS